MDILVKGMEMPRFCADCPFWETRYDPGYYNYEHCKALGKIFNECRRDISPFEEKLDDCPLVEIPTPHGRLIDADALDKELRRKWNYGDNGVTIANAPTILEAEEQDDI